MRPKTLEPDRRLVAWSLNNLANALPKQRKYGEAETIHGEALATLRRVHGSEHPDVALALGNLATDLYHEDKNAEAVETQREALALDAGSSATRAWQWRPSSTTSRRCSRRRIVSPRPRRCTSKRSASSAAPAKP